MKRNTAQRLLQEIAELRLQGKHAEAWSRLTSTVLAEECREDPHYWSMRADSAHIAGSDHPEKSMLEDAVGALGAALPLYPRERMPLEWAATQNNLGNALRALGEREQGTARLAEAVAAIRATLEVYARERAPLDWAITQHNLGNALRALGEREEGTARLAEAVAAIRTALEEFEGAQVPHMCQLARQDLARAEKSLATRQSRG